jgi:hypothetical protein
MLDMIYFAIAILFFILAGVYVVGCERLNR